MPSDLPPTDAIPLIETADPVAVDLARRLRKRATAYEPLDKSFDWTDDPDHPGVVALTPSLSPANCVRHLRPRLSSNKAYKLAFRPVYDKLRSGELQAWARRDILDERRAIPASVWRTLRFWDTDWERGVIFPLLPHQTLYESCRPGHSDE